MRPLTSKITLTNRQAGPDALLQVVEDRSMRWKNDEEYREKRLNSMKLLMFLV